MRNLIVVLFVLSACSDGIKTLPDSTGILSEVIFVVDDLLWDNQVKDIAFRTFGVPIQGLTQDESSFKVIQVNHSEFKSILKTHKNIVIIAKNVLTSNQQDKWANGQLVVQLEFKDQDDKLSIDLNKVKAIFEFREIKILRTNISKSSQKKQEKHIKKQFNIEILIPSEYTIIKDTAALFWAIYNPEKQEEIKHLFVFSFEPKAINLQQEVLQKTDSIFSKYLLGAKQGQYVKIEDMFSPIYSENVFRGLWKLNGGFMGGAFLLKTYFINKKVVVTAGLIFAPNERKRKYIKTFEAIL
ncbi:MAG: DUF4837 family protein [Flavobacteriales bacterium]|jgi:hypothetical protein|nr:DUF4837 family protein [Flavobacteriales bacterium]MBT5090705.1 DUF4837 family protein [Flavobacteriales bacterium]MBT5750574.1 DUF4837 family protein [Flavobacteriales bacterium]